MPKDSDIAQEEYEAIPVTILSVQEVYNAEQISAPGSTNRQRTTFTTTAIHFNYLLYDLFCPNLVIHKTWY